MTGKDLFIMFYSMEDNQKMLLRFKKEIEKDKEQFEENMLAVIECIELENDKIQIFINEEKFKEHNVLLEKERWIESLDKTPKKYSEKLLRLRHKMFEMNLKEEINKFEPIIL